MATKKAPDDVFPSLSEGDAELDQAIDDLRGVLKSDANNAIAGDDVFAGSMSGMDGMSSFSASEELGGFGGDFAADTTSSNSLAGSGRSSRSRPLRAGAEIPANLELIMDIPIDVQIVLGSSRMQVSSLMSLTEGATIGLDRKIGEPVEVTVNGRVIGRGEITVLDEDDTRFGVRLIEIRSGRG
ncbi:flagellar motor switch protein FliN [Rhizobium rhizosphaerae]|uniref:Flagellar motor switch protein FliN n=1 Tax=Xaviernesmea rhizosphaerae TaxID=1672749 RepID=A0A1Q9AIN0_9HYPH|nr:flagellar motor switch protein FliN [Xaviernesmea rhizosphaerae]OLP55067.1 flagellar motor switch protein FliN [Xaviernesmea rhizosphaerae]OQP83554.1 flagellar motor switch protein FliN [Xaviernesmea rhizosphaerae]